MLKLMDKMNNIVIMSKSTKIKITTKIKVKIKKRKDIYPLITSTNFGKILV